MQRQLRQQPAGQGAAGHAPLSEAGGHIKPASPGGLADVGDAVRGFVVLRRPFGQQPAFSGQLPGEGQQRVVVRLRIRHAAAGGMGFAGHNQNRFPVFYVGAHRTGRLTRVDIVILGPGALGLHGDGIAALWVQAGEKQI
ncbi:hypothetical protein SDC9_150597 [bioreactor metagenome]|uniref:Uncharacterized protein n=1 Tax=bioreactor metagenome TaxID=1076179 RepID=A0A645EQD7_9ZZZZ